MPRGVSRKDGRRKVKKACNPKVTLYCVATKILKKPYTTLNFWYEDKRGWKGRRLRLGKVGPKALDACQIQEVADFVGKKITKTQIIRKMLTEWR